MTEQPSADPGAGRTPLPTKALETTAENPWPVRLLSSKIADYVARMPSVWVEGQIVDLNAQTRIAWNDYARSVNAYTSTTPLL